MMANQMLDFGKADVNSALAYNYGISENSTIEFLKNGRLIDYDGGQTAEEIVKWYKKNNASSTNNICILVFAIVANLLFK